MSLGPLMIDVAGTSLTVEDRELLLHPSVGSVILFSRNFTDPAQLQALVAEIHLLRQPALLVAVDQEGGRVQRFRNGFTTLPALRQVGRHFDEQRAQGLQLARQHGWLMAAELVACGVDFSLAPCVDLDYGMNAAIGERALHPRGSVVAELAVAYMHGMREAGMAATAKHFPGHGAVVADSHFALPVDRRELADLDDDLRPYRLLIDNGLPAVMVAHILFPAVDQRPASFSRFWINDYLRGELRFKGTVFADDLSMLGAAGMGDVIERCALALEAGCDVLPVCNSRDQVIKLISGLQVQSDPARHLRLARMRGRPQMSAAQLRTSSEWQVSERAITLCHEPPALQLRGASA
jgi:beta-N-acetylhexosaminidase